MLTRLAAQLCAVQALKGATIVQNNVRDSSVGVIAIDADGDIRTTEQKPFINVFSEDTASSGDTAALVGPSQSTQVFQFGITSAMPLITADGNYLVDAETGEIVFAERDKPSDAQINILLEVVERQIRVALTDPNNAWAELWGSFYSNTLEVKSMRGQSARESVRFGARQLSVTGTLIAEPPYGMPVKDKSIWKNFLDQLTGSEIEHVRDDIERLIGSGDLQSDLDYLRRRYGHSGEQATALGYGFEANRDPDVPIQTTVLADIDE